MTETPDIGDDVIAGIRAHVDRGDYLRAFDLADSVANGDLRANQLAELSYLRILSLARSGATRRAAEELAKWSIDEADLSPRLSEDRAALGARLAKDRALEDAAPDLSRIAHAARLYEEISDRLDRPFASINAATLWLLAGDEARARQLAHRTQTLLHASEVDDPLDRYWATATAAEAALVLGDPASCGTLVAEAAEQASSNLGARASTRRQLTLLCEHLGLDADAMLDPLTNPTVLHYCGHRVSAPDSDRFEAELVPQIRAAIDESAAGHGLAAAHGSLACGSDILIAEALLDTGVPLHVVLPFDPAEFIDVSVGTGGAAWAHRFERCMNAAESVIVASDSGYLGDDNLFAYASRIAMGEAINRARRIAAPRIQIAVWDGIDAGEPAGTAHDVRIWGETGGRTHIIEVTSNGRSSPQPRTTRALSRPLTAVLFGDIQGISRLRDEELALFLPSVLDAVASAIEPFGAALVQRNTWGDAVFLAFDDVLSAARSALAIQRALQSIDLAQMGLPGDLSLRLAAHVGPTLRLFDPLRGSDGIFGRELTRAARIEPRTPPGAVYATSAFAAMLALETECEIAAEYVGTLTTAKGFETIPMFVLQSR